MNVRTWIVLADAATARIYQPQADGRDWTPIAELNHPESRAKESELGRDKPGRVKQSGGSRKFARQIVKTLDDALLRKAYDHLILAAPPELVGVLRKLLPRRVEDRIAATVEKDYVHLDPPEVRDRLEKQLAAR